MSFGAGSWTWASCSSCVKSPSGLLLESLAECDALVSILDAHP